MKLLKTVLLSLILLVSLAPAQAQGDWEVNMLRGINPRYPNSGFWKGISSTAKPLSVAVPAGFLLAGLLEHNNTLKQDALVMGGSLVIAAGATAILKQVVKRQRPWVTHNDIYADDMADAGYSFPSGHASVAFATAAGLAIRHPKWYIVVPAYTWATAVGWSRMYLGQHYPTDILMSAGTGIGSAYLSNWLNKKLFPSKPSLKPKS